MVLLGLAEAAALLIAAAGRDGRKLLVIGVGEENIARLLNDEPIYKKLDGTDDEAMGDGG